MEMPVDAVSLCILIGVFLTTGLIVLLDWLDMRRIENIAKGTERRENEAKRYFEGNGK